MWFNIGNKREKKYKVIPYNTFPTKLHTTNFTLHATYLKSTLHTNQYALNTKQQAQHIKHFTLHITHITPLTIPYTLHTK